jgi:hypothetical protein
LSDTFVFNFSCSGYFLHFTTITSTTSPPPSGLDLVTQIIEPATFIRLYEVSAKSAENWQFCGRFLEIRVFSPTNIGRRVRTPPGLLAPPKFFLIPGVEGWAVK